MNSQSLENPFASAFRTSVLVLALVVAGILFAFMPQVVVLLVPLAAAAFLWVLFRYPVAALGALLFFMPIDYMAIELGKFAGLPYMSVVSACTKEIPLLLLTLLLWRRNGFTIAAPDWLLLACFAVAALHTVFDGTMTALAVDFNFAIAYWAGRMTVLTEEQERRWAGRAVWLVGILAVLGLIEVFVLGDGPRTLLYMDTGAVMDGTSLPGSFHASGYGGLREASTMLGPNSFGILCMVGLIIWWIYCRNPLPAGMITLGLVCSLTRSALVGTAAAIPLLAFVMNQQKRFFLYLTLALALFVASIPVLDLSDYLLANKTGQDTSAEGHRNEILAGMDYVAEHPLGSGNQKLSVMDRDVNANAVSFETTYINFAAEYGIAADLCLVGWLTSALFVTLRKRSRLGYAAAGILVGIGLVMVVAIPLIDRRLASWVFFPVGLAVRQAMSVQESG